MRYDNLPAFEKYLEGTPLKQLSHLYFIIGKERVECQEAIDHLLRFILPPDAIREFALIPFNGSHIDEAALTNALDSGSFFSKSQVVCIQQFEDSKKNIQEKIEKNISHPQPSQYILLHATSWPKNSSFYKTAEKQGIVLDLVELKPWEKEKRLVAWVNKQATAARKLIPYPVCQLLVKRVGHDQGLLTQEIEKLMIYCADKKEITAQDVEAICIQEQADTIWQLGEAIFRRDTATALHIGNAFLIDGQALLPLLRQIRSQFQTELQVCLLVAQGKQGHEITQQFPYMKGQILERHLHQAQHYGLKAIKEGLLVIDETELRAKNSSTDERILLELLLCYLTIDKDKK